MAEKLPAQGHASLSDESKDSPDPKYRGKALAGNGGTSRLVRGRIRRKFTRDPQGARYEVVGPARDGREIAVICRIKSTGKLLFITTYAL